MSTGLNSLGLIEAARDISNGVITSRELVDDCLGRIDAFEPTVKAWAHLDPDHARKQADQADEIRRSGKPTGPLHGVPIGLKDIIDTKFVPTEFGSPIFKGRKPTNDAVIVTRLKQAGAIIMGKTVTAELANMTPGPTTNPHNAAHTPGGSSSGSAAAVASYMVQGAVGTQTGGSVIRPASYCGVYGYKPSFGTIPRTGVLTQSKRLDQIGTFGRSLADTALLAQVMMGTDAGDPDSLPERSIANLAKAATDGPLVDPKVAFLTAPYQSAAEQPTQEAFDELFDVLSQIRESRVEKIELTPSFDTALDSHRAMMSSEIAQTYIPLLARYPGKISDALVAYIEEGRSITAVDYLNAVDEKNRLLDILNELAFEEFDAIIAPAATGEAPGSLETTGDPVFCSLWSYLGLPAISLPIMQGPNGLPLGVQLIGPVGGDQQLLQVAQWIEAGLEDGD